MLDLQQLETFRAVALTGSFTRAALTLGYAQPSVTARVKGLERELGTPLFERHRFSRNVILTESGRLVFEYAGRLLALASETKLAVLTTKNCVARQRCGSSLGLPIDDRLQQCGDAV